jgi:hypothetical protein
MTYRGIEYEVVQTINKKWRWSVKRERTDKVGIAMDRKSAIIRAQRFIDELLKTRAKAQQ